MSIIIKNAVTALRQQMLDLILQAAQQVPDVSFRTGHADGTWGVTVQADGRVLNQGYAEENYGEVRTVGQLATWELGALVETLEIRFGKAG